MKLFVWLKWTWCIHPQICLLCRHHPVSGGPLYGAFSPCLAVSQLSSKWQGWVAGVCSLSAGVPELCQERVAPRTVEEALVSSNHAVDTSSYRLVVKANLSGKCDAPEKRDPRLGSRHQSLGLWACLGGGAFSPLLIDVAWSRP